MKKSLQLMASLLLVISLFITCSKDDIPVVQYSLSVEVNPAEGGSVSPAVGSFDEGVSKTITAIPSSEYVFKNWLGGATGTDNPTTVIMNSNKTITAVFEKKMYAFNILYEGEGSVSAEVEGLNTDGTISSGSTVELTAIPVEGWEFVAWSGDITSVENPLTLTMDEAKEITAIFQPILYNQILGKWDVNNLSGKPFSNKSSSTQDDTISAKTTDGECVVYSLVFNSDGTFILSLDSGEIQGTFTFDSVNSIVLTNIGTVTNISITSGTITFSLSLTNLCNTDGDADNDEDYEEGECVSFLNCYDGNVWRKQVEDGYKYIRITNNLTDVWLENFLFNTTRQCTESPVNNQTSEFDIILVENDITQMTYVLDDTPNGDVSVIVSITADNHLSVNYDYNDDLLDNADYYDLSSQESLNEYLNSYSECPQLTYVPDDNFEQWLIDLGYDDVLDDYVLTSNIVGVEELCADEYSVNDFTGIEDFVGLKTLCVYWGDFESIDLSNNLNLQRLTLQGESLLNIDLSKNINLEFIGLWGNKLSSIDLSGNTALTYLNLSENQLTNIDLTNNKALANLRLYNNQLTSLDVSANIALTTLHLRNNQLTSIDLSANTALTELSLSNNQLTSIDISANIALTNLSLNYNPDLTCIQVNEAQLENHQDTDYNSSYYFTKDAGVVFSLDCSNPNAGKTYVPDDNFEQALIDYGYDDVLDDYVLTSNIVDVTTLNLSNPEDAVETKKINSLIGVEDFKSLENLDLTYNQLTSIDVSSNTALQSLNLDQNQLTSLDISKNVLLRAFNVRANQLKALDISNNVLLESVFCYQNQIMSLDVSNNVLLTVLDCMRNELTELDISKNIALILLYCNTNKLISLDTSQNTKLRTLWFAENDIATIELSQNPDIDYLVCSNTKLTELDITPLTDLIHFFCYNQNLPCIKTNKPIEDIPISWYKYASTSYSADCSAKTYVPDNTFEQYLINMGYDDVLDDYVLTSNIVGVEELDFLEVIYGASELTGIEDFLGLKSLSLYANQFNIESINFYNNTNLESLTIGEGYLLAFLDVTKNTKLKELHLDGANTSPITSLDLSQNLALETLFLTSTNLSRLDVSNNTVLESFTHDGNNNLTCIQVNQSQLSNIPIGWSNGDTASYSLDCDNSFKVELGITGYTNSCDVQADYFYYEINYRFDDNDVIFEGAEGFEGTSYNHSQEMVCYSNLEIDILLGSFNPDIPSEAFKGAYLDNMTLKITDLKTNQVVLDKTLPSLFICTDTAYKNVINFNPNTGEYSIETLTFGF